LCAANGFGHDLAETLLDDLRAAVERLDQENLTARATGPAGFRH
jgi:hypothetical protein